MTFKLLIRNVKKDYKDYGIFIITMMICSGVYYAFFSITSKWYNPNVSVVYDLSHVEGIIRYSIAGVSLVSVFLVKHVTGYLSLKKQKEFGLQNLMGLNKKTISTLFFREILLLGVISTLMGIVLGGVLSQFINFFLIRTFDGTAQFMFPYYPDTIFYTIIFFAAIFGIVGKLESYKLLKKKIIDMIYAEENEQVNEKDIVIKVIHLFGLIVNIYYTYLGYVNLDNYYDSRIPLLGKFIYVSLFLFPPCYVIVLIVSKLLKKSDSKTSKILVPIEIILAISNVFYIFGLVKLNLPGDTNFSFRYLLNSGIYVAFFIYHYFYIYRFKSKNNSWESIFLKGQVSSKLKKYRQIFSLISIIIYASILLFIVQPIITAWAEGYLNSRMTQDIQIITTYNSVAEEKNISWDRFESIFEFLEKENIEIEDSVFMNTYLPKHSDFRKRVRYDFPMTILKLSEYNDLLAMNGYKPISLESNEYAIQIKHNTKEVEYDHDIFNGLETDNGRYDLKRNGVYDYEISEYLFNSHVDAIYILNDTNVDGLLFVGTNLFIDLANDLDIVRARELDELFNLNYEDVTGGPSRFIRLYSIEKNNISTYNFLLRTVMNYLAIILLLISFTIIALIELEDSLYNKDRYTKLWQLGVHKREINKLTSKQLLFSFWRPLMIGLLGAVSIGAMFLLSISHKIKAYVDASIFASIGTVLFIILILLLVYYLLTYYMFLSNLKGKGDLN